MNKELFESCVNSKYSKTKFKSPMRLWQFESCVNSKYSKTGFWRSSVVNNV